MTYRPGEADAHKKMTQRINVMRQVAFDFIAHPVTLENHEMIKQVVATANRVIAEERAAFERIYPQ